MIRRTAVWVLGASLFGLSAFCGEEVPAAAPAPDSAPAAELAPPPDAATPAATPETPAPAPTPEAPAPEAAAPVAPAAAAPAVPATDVPAAAPASSDASVSGLVETIRTTMDYGAQKAAAETLIARGAPVAPEALALLGDTAPLVRVFGILILRGTKDASGAAALIEMLTDEEATIRYHANLALKTISGKDADYFHLSPAAEREAGAERWAGLLGVKRPEKKKAEPPVAAAPLPPLPAPKAAAPTVKPAATPAYHKKAAKKPAKGETAKPWTVRVIEREIPDSDHGY